MLLVPSQERRFGKAGFSIYDVRVSAVIMCKREAGQRGAFLRAPDVAPSLLDFIGNARPGGRADVRTATDMRRHDRKWQVLFSWHSESFRIENWKCVSG